MQRKVMEKRDPFICPLLSKLESLETLVNGLLLPGMVFIPSFDAFVFAKRATPTRALRHHSSELQRQFSGGGAHYAHSSVAALVRTATMLFATQPSSSWQSDSDHHQG